MGDPREEMDFPQILQELNKGPVKEKDMPPLHPRPDELVDISKKETEEQITSKLLKSKKFKSNYRVYDIADEDQCTALEEVMDHILRDGWMLGYEEKQIMQSGRVIVFLKYLIPDAPPPKLTAADIADARSK